MKTHFTCAVSARNVATLLASACLAGTSFAVDPDCLGPQGLIVEFQTASVSRSKCAGFAPYQLVSPTTRHRVETITESADPLTISETVSTNDAVCAGRYAACGGTVDLSTSFTWDVSGGNTNASVDFQIKMVTSQGATTVVTNYSVTVYDGSSGNQTVNFPIAGGQYPVIAINAHIPSGLSTVAFEPTETLGTIVSTYTILTNGAGCAGPATSGTNVTSGYASGWVIIDSTAKYITNSPDYTPARKDSMLGDEYTTPLLESLARDDLEPVDGSGWALRNATPYLTARRSLAPDELSISLRKLRTRMTFSSVPGESYRLTWIESTVADDGGVGGYEHRQREVYGAPNARTTTVTNDWISPPPFNGDTSVLEPAVTLAQQCADCEAGGGNLDADGVNYSLDLGPGAFDRAVGGLSLHQRSPVNLGDPGWLRFTGNTNYAEVITAGGTVIRQVKSPQMLADVIVISNAPGGVPIAYTIDCYSPANVGAKGTNGLYQPLNSPFVKWTISNRDASPTSCANLMITETRGSRVYTNTYTHTNNAGVNRWTLSAGNGLFVKSVEDDFGSPGTNHTQTTLIANPDGPPLRITKHFGLTPWREMLKTSESNDTQWVEYHYDAYGRPDYTLHSDGKWESYTYDSSGRISGLQSAFMNYSITSGGKRLTEFEYGTNVISGSGDTGEDLWIPRRVTDRVYPNVFTSVGVRQTDHVLGDGWRKLIFDLAANWSHPTNNVTLMTWYTNGDFKDKVRSIDYPDTTRAVFFYQTNATTKTTTVLKGEADPGNATNVLRGTRSVVVVGLFGETLAVTNYYFSPAGSVLTGQEVYEYFDDMGRSHRCHYLDGTSRLVQYSCCGLEHIEERDGSSQWFFHDDLKRTTGILWLPDNILLTNRLDGLGRIVNTTRISSNGTVQFLYGASYDAQGRIATETNALNGVTSYAYTTNAQGQTIVTITYPDQGTRVETYALDGSLNIVDGTASFPMRFDLAIAGWQPSNYRLARNTIWLGPSGSTNEWIRQHITSLGTVDIVQRAGTVGTLNYIYNYSRGQLTKITDEENASHLFAYDALGRQDTVAFDRDNNGNIDHAGQDRVTKVITDALTNASGVAVVRQQTYVWDQEGSSVSNLIASTEVSCDGLQSWETVYTAATSLTTSNQTAYYSNGLVVITSTSPDNSQLVVTNRCGRRISETAYDGSNPRQKIAQVIYGYDAFGRRNTVTDDRNGTTTYFFNNAGQISGIALPPVAGVSLTTSNYFNVMGRVWKTTLPDGTSVTNEYFPTGLLKKTSGSRTYPVEYTYDTQGRVKTMITWGAAGPETNTWNYNIYRGWLEQRIYPDGSGPSYTYKDAGRPLTRTWVRKYGANPITTTYGHNRDELVQLTYSDATPLVKFQFNRLGQVTNVIANSITSTRKYDRLGNLLSESHSGGTLNGLSLTNQYDALLRRTSVAALDGSTTLSKTGYDYDAASRLRSVSQLDPNFASVSASYRYVSSSPLVESITFTNSGAARLTLNKSYDALERLTSIQSINHLPSTIDSFAYKYNTASQRTAVTNEANSYWVYQYDALGQVTSARRYWSDGTAIAGQQYNFTFDTIGNLTATATGGDQNGQHLRAASYTANALNQYTSRTVPGYVESFGTAHSNATVTVNFQPTYRHGEYFRRELAVLNGIARWQGVTNIGVLNNGTNADIVTTNLAFTFVPATPESFLYDPDGNITNDGRFAYTWDAENRLLTMTSPTNVPAGARRKLTFEYDWAGRRIRRDVSLWTNNNWLVTDAKKFCYDGWNLLAELSATNNALIRSYAWGLDVSATMDGAGGVGALLWVNDQSTFNAQPSTHLASYDGNGNVSSLVSAGDGALSAKYDYGPFGDLLQASGPMARANPIRFSSKYQDNDTSLSYYGYRYYAPSLQRWLNRDPLGEEGGLNLYGFVGNDPVSLVDKDGRVPPLVAVLLVGALIDGGLSILGQTLDPCFDGKIDWSRVGKDTAIGAGLSVGTLGLSRLYELYKAAKLLRALEEGAELASRGRFDDLARLLARGGPGFENALMAHRRANAAVAEARAAFAAGNRVASGARGVVSGAGNAGRTASSFGPRTWNEFEAATRGQFASRAEAAQAWAAYKGAAKSGEEFLKLYRGERAGNTVMKSYAAREGGYAYSQNLIRNGNVDDLMRAHVLDSANPASPFISTTSDPNVARFFAGPNGVVYELRIPASRATQNPFNNMLVPAGPGGSLVPESEFLVPNYIRPGEIVR